MLLITLTRSIIISYRMNVCNSNKLKSLHFDEIRFYAHDVAFKQRRYLLAVKQRVSQKRNEYIFILHIFKSLNVK